MIRSLTVPDPERDHICGSADGSSRLLEYGDYECPFCGEAQPIVKEIQRRLGGVRAGVNGTPTFFINGERYDGARDLKHLLNALAAK